MRFFRGRERAKEEGLRSAYPEAWLAGENLANHLFRDMVFCGMEPGGERGRRKDLEEAAESQADEAEDRYLFTRGLERGAVHPHALRALRVGFSRRLASLVIAHEKMAPREDPDIAFDHISGMMNPGTAQALALEAEAARQSSDIIEGLYMQRSFAAEKLKAAGATGSMSLRELAALDRDALADLLQAQVFLGLEPLDHSLRELLGEEGWRRVAGANEARERRLRGGPLVPERF